MPTYVAPSCNGPTVQEDQDASTGVPLTVASAGVVPSGGTPQIRRYGSNQIPKKLVFVVIYFDFCEKPKKAKK